MNEHIRLRDYQRECLEIICDEFHRGINRQLIILPTGSGKTVLMAAIAKKFNARTLLLAHREELITQAIDKFKLFWPDANIGICMADHEDIDKQVVVGSIQSCSRPRRLERLKEINFELLMIDEAHHSPSDSYQAIINALGFKMNSQKLLVGVTATPQRSDKLGLGDTFDQVTFSRSISTMIKGGYLAPITSRKILTNFSLDKIRSNNGDFSIMELSEAVNTPERNAFIVSKYQEYALDRKSIAFCCDVRHCHDLANAFRGAGFDSAAVFGEMDSRERKSQLEAFKQGKIQILTSCGILTEGYDEPSVNAIVMARPTKSSGLYTQCIGRSLRLSPGKENCLVLDFTDKHHTLDGIMSLSDALPEAPAIKDKPKIELEETDRNPKIEILNECDCEFNILGNAKFIWVQIESEWSLQDDERNEIVMRQEKTGYVATLYFSDGTAYQVVASPLPIEYCRGVCEDYARRNLKLAFADPSRDWLSANAAPTQNQVNYLKKKGAYRDGMTRSLASIEIRKIVAKRNQDRRTMENEPITVKQGYFLRSHGIDVKDMTKLQAIQVIAKIKQNEKITPEMVVRA